MTVKGLLRRAAKWLIEKIGDEVEKEVEKKTHKR